MTDVYAAAGLVASATSSTVHRPGTRMLTGADPGDPGLDRSPLGRLLDREQLPALAARARTALTQIRAREGWVVSRYPGTETALEQVEEALG